jgi:hypothetical protein
MLVTRRVAAELLACETRASATAPKHGARRAHTLMPQATALAAGSTRGAKRARDLDAAPAALAAAGAGKREAQLALKPAFLLPRLVSPPGGVRDFALPAEFVAGAIDDEDPR